jgi:hypothetical protein
MPVTNRRIGRRASAAYCCLSLAAPAALSGQGLAHKATAAFQPIQTPIGIDFQYGLVVGSSPLFINKAPHPDNSGRALLRAAVSLGGQAVVDFLTPSKRVFRNGTVSLRASMSQVRQQRFYGYQGHGDAFEAAPALTGIRQTRISVEPTLTVAPHGSPFRISAGPVVKYTTTRFSGFTAATATRSEATSHYITGGFGQVGAQATATAEWRNDLIDPTHGLRVDVGGSAYAPVWDVQDPLAEIHAEARGMVRLPLPANPALVMRAGGRQVFGEVPIHEAAYLGGTGTLRGAPGFRYAGSSMLYGGGEIRVGVAQPTILGRSFRLGVAGVADAGRVSYQGTASQWLASYGAGLWVKPLDSPQVFSAGIVQGPLGAKFYFRTDIGY